MKIPLPNLPAGKVAIASTDLFEPKRNRIATTGNVNASRLSAVKLKKEREPT
jgi:hypothetical protein